MPESREGSRIRFSGVSESAFFPTRETDLSVTREFDGRLEPFRVGGATYARSVNLIGSGIIEGVVAARDDIALGPVDDGQRLLLRGGAITRGAVISVADALPIRRGLCGGVDKAATLIRGDVVAQHVSLRNTIVLGNIHAHSIRIDNCVVVGAIVAKDSLTVSASSTLQYHARHVTFEGPCTFLNASGESASKPVFAAYEDGAGEAYPFRGLFYPAIRGRSGGAICNGPVPDGEPFDSASLCETSDWIRVPVSSGVTGGSNSRPDSAWVLTIAARAMNLAALARAIEQMASWIRTCFEFDHYTDQARREATALLRAECTADELWIAEQTLMSGLDVETA